MLVFKMTNSPTPTKTEIKTLTARVEALHAELADPYTKALGAAAERSVRETLEVWEAELVARKSLRSRSKCPSRWLAAD